MEMLTWWQYYWQALLKALEFPNNILGIIGVVILLIKLIPPNIERNWRESEMSKYYLWIKKHSLKIFGILILITLVYAPYGMYKDAENKYQQVIEENRPILTLDPAITLNPDIDEIHQIASTNINIKVNNIGDRPAYQIYSPMWCAPLDDPKNLTIYENAYDTNPVYKGTQNNLVLKHTGAYSRRNNIGTIIFRLYIKYSDVPLGKKDGRWYEDEYWFSFNINLQDKNVTLNPPTPEVISSLKNYFPIIPSLKQ